MPAPEPHRLSRADVRRIAVQAQLLDQPRPTDLFDVVSHLTLLQLDPTAAVAPNADLVLWSRLGSTYSRADLRVALADRRLVDHQGAVRTGDYLALLRADMADWPGRGELLDWQVELRDWVTANDACRRDILERLAAGGPMTAGELPDTCAVPWRSSGWNNHRNVNRLLDQMEARGEVAVSGRRGRDREWDLASRVLRDDAAVPADEARRVRDVRRLEALGIARSRTVWCSVDANGVGDAGEAAVVEGVPGEWRVEPALLDTQLTGRAALISPLDRLVYDRRRMAEIFDFDYQLEMYKPAASRRWGYFALPILWGDRLVGKLDAKADHKGGLLRVRAVHEDLPFTDEMTDAVTEELADLARWLELDLAH